MTASDRDTLRRALADRGDRTYLRLPHKTLSGRQVLDRADAATGGLTELGLEPGEPVALRSEPSAAFVVALLALWSLGLVACPLAPTSPVAAVEEARRRLGFRVLLHAGRPLPGLRDLAQSPLEPIAAAVAPLGPARPLAADAATALHTSGSSARPKIAIHTLGQHFASARGALGFTALEPNDSWLLTLPLFHVAGLGIVFRTLLSGATLAVPRDRDLADALEHFRPTHVSLVGTQLVRLLENEDALRCLARCKTVLLGGSSIAVPVRRWALGAGIPLVVSYGCTEASSLITAERDPSRLLRPGTAGRVLPGRQIEISDHGEILLSGASLFSGYLEHGTLVDPRDERGRFATGDLGSLDSQGNLVVLGRADDMLISGGENIQPDEIEAALLALPAIDEAVVVAVPHPEYGQRPVAFVQLRLGRVVAEAELRQHLESVLPRYKVPDVILRLPAQVRGELKPDRRALRAIAAAPEQYASLRL